ncbi:MAG: hypothetical protein H0V07_09145 [Propionibacteriales bacterium]|nr:hypothetical protein [Propionibacteriales bacterium]
MALGLVAARTAKWSVLGAAGAVVPFIPYSTDSFFRSRVAGAAPDAARTSAFKAFMATFVDQEAVPYPKISGTGKNRWGTVFHLGKSTDPVWKLAGPGVRPETQIAATQGFHMADAVADEFPTGSEDRTGIIVDPVFGCALQTGDSAPDKATRTITVQSSGIFYASSNGLDRRNPLGNDPRNWCSRGRIPDALVIRRDLVNAAIGNGTGLGHVLQMSLCETNSADAFVHPMVGAEKNKFGWGAEGTRIAIRPDVGLVARGLTGAPWRWLGPCRRVGVT